MTYKKLLVMFIIGILLVGIGAGVTVVEYGSYKYMGKKTAAQSAGDYDTETYEISLPRDTGNRNIRLTLDLYGQPQSPDALSDGTFTLVEDDSVPDNMMRIDVSCDEQYFQSGTTTESYLWHDGERIYDFYYDRAQGRYYYYNFREYYGDGYDDEYDYYDDEYPTDTDDDASEPRPERIYPEDGQYEFTTAVNVYTYKSSDPIFQIFNGVNMEEVLEDLKHKEIYDYDVDCDAKVTVYANAATLAQIKY